MNYKVRLKIVLKNGIWDILNKKASFSAFFQISVSLLNNFNCTFAKEENFLSTSAVGAFIVRIKPSFNTLMLIFLMFDFPLFNNY